MGLTIRCDSAKAVNFPSNLNTDICGICAVKWQVTGFACLVLLAVNLYLLRHWRFRCHKTLLTFHNLRAAVALLLLAINSLELARAFLPLPSFSAPTNGHNNNNSIGNSNNGAAGYNNGGNGSGYGGSGSNFSIPAINTIQQQEGQQQQMDSDHVVVIIGMATLLRNALAAILFTIMLMWHHRVVELKKSVAWLYVSSAAAVSIFMLRIYALAEIVYDRNIFELEPSLQAMSAICLLSLGIIDGFTVYKERYRPDYLEDYEKIGYKHTLATFYSKACFWWLTSLLVFGYKEPLELEDLGQMRVEDSARAHYDRFLLIYKTAKVKNADRPPSLWLCYAKSSWRTFTLGGVLKLFGDLFALIGPLAIQQIVQYIEVMYGLHYAGAAAAALRPQMNSNNNNNGSDSSSAGDGNYNNYNNGNIVNNDNSSMGLRGVGGGGGRHFSIRATGSLWMQSAAVDRVGDNARQFDDEMPSYYNNYNNYNSDDDNNGADVKIYYASWLDLVSNGWAVAWIVLLAALAQGALSQASTHILNMTGIRIKTSLQGLIYRKTLLLNSSSCIAGIDGAQETGAAGAAQVPGFNERPNASNCENHVAVDNASKEQQQQQQQKQHQQQQKQQHRQDNGEGLSDVGAITNLMSEDTLNIMTFFFLAHYVWAIPLKIAVVMYLLYLKLGISAVIGSFVCILTMTPLQFLIGKAMSSNTEVMAKYTDERLKKIHDTFVGIKLIKLNAWDDVFLRRICAAREKELKYLNKDSFYWTLMTMLTHISTVLITFVTLAFYVCLEDVGSSAANESSSSSNTASSFSTNFTASRLFSALALFQQLTVPLLIFPITVPIIISAVVSTRRLERFLHAREIQKQFEGIRNMARILSKSDASLDMYEVKQRQPISLAANTEPLKSADSAQMQKENTLNERLALRIVIPDKPAPLAQSEPQSPLSISAECAALAATGEPLSEDKAPPDCLCGNGCALKYYEGRAKRLSLQRRDLLRNTPYVVIRPRRLTLTSASHLSLNSTAKRFDSLHRDALLLKMPDDVAVSVKECRFAWHPQRLQSGGGGGTLYISDVEIPKCGLTVIVGKNGSGKSSLLAALLMEMPLISGDMVWNKTSTTAFVPQQPWLLNASIRENILFGESFRPKRFDFVLEACALKPDIELMPQADFTVIGERGINLSGGQRQRVAIARALYSSANVVIMDDPLSSLDNEVARHIFEQAIRKMLLKAGRTVILVTQQLLLVHQADYLIVMKDRCLLASGTFKDIEVKHPNIIAKWNAIIAKANEREQQNSSAALGRTARERWKLFKNVSRMGLQRSVSALEATTTSAASVGQETQAAAASENDDDDDVLPASLHSMPPNALRSTQSFGSFSYARNKRPSSVYGSSRHLIYDVPLPIDECQTEDVIMRPRRRASLRRTARSNSRASSTRFSGASNASDSEFRRSLLTASCSSATSYASSRSNGSSGGGGTQAPDVAAPRGETGTARQLRVRSWQPQSVASAAATGADAKWQHKPVTRNISSPARFLTDSSVRKDDDAATSAAAFEEEEKEKDDELEEVEALHFDAAFAADLLQSAARPEGGGFQQFLRRMSMRRSNKPNAVAVHRKHHHHHRPVSDTNSILSISEETTSAAAATSTPATPAAATASLPSIELSSVEATAAEAAAAAEETETDTDTDSCWIANIADEPKPAPTVLAPNDVGANNLNAAAAAAQGGTTSPAATVTAAATTAATLAATMTTTTATDVERKYGKIPTQIYLLYLRASGFPIVLIFFATALIWQCLRVYTDVWLQHWTDDSGNGSGRNMNTSSNNGATSTSTSTSISTFTSGAAHEVTYYFRVYAAISCVCIAMAMISTPAGQLAGCNARRNLHDKLLQTIMRKSLHFFQLTPLGRIMNRFSNDMAIIDKKIAATSQRLLQFTLLCLCAILINVSVTPWFVLLTLPICAAYYAIQKFYRCSSRELQRIENSTNSPVISHLSETIQGVTTIRAYNQEARFTEILFRRLEANTIAFTTLNTSNRWLGISLDYLGGVIVFVAIVTALLAATISCSRHLDGKSAEERATYSNLNAGANKNNMATLALAFTPSPSLVGLAINYTLLVPIYLNWVVKLLADMEMYVGSVERIAYYAEAEQQQTRRAQTEIANDESAKEEEEENSEADDKVDEQDATAAAVAKVDKASASASAAGGSATGPVVKPQVAAAVNGEVATSSSASSSSSSSAVMERNDAERRASVRRAEANDRKYKTVPISWPKRGDISFERVSLRYEGQNADVIRNLTLHIPAGQRIGICGRTGSGKSSLALSLFGVIRTTSGRIRIDDVDIAQIHPDEMRSRLSIIPQDVHLFSATIRENLDPPGYYADGALWNCLEMAQLKEFVNRQLPHGLDTEITDGGRSFSAGHRQLFCLARAILRGSVCLILDEATSSLDSTTENALLAAAHMAFRGRTILTIAHRLSTILDYDRILVLERGKIVEDGSPLELQRKEGGVFNSLLHSGRHLSAQSDADAPQVFLASDK